MATLLCSCRIMLLPQTPMEPCRHFVLSRDDQLLYFWNSVLINVMHHYGGPGSYHLLCIWPFHPDVLHSNPKFGSVPFWVALLLWIVFLLSMELKVLDIMGSVALEYQANIPIAFWILTFDSICRQWRRCVLWSCCLLLSSIFDWRRCGWSMLWLGWRGML